MQKLKDMEDIKLKKKKYPESQRGVYLQRKILAFFSDHVC
jgi:hypothetical protein